MNFLVTGKKSIHLKRNIFSAYEVNNNFIVLFALILLDKISLTNECFLTNLDEEASQHKYLC